MCSAIKSCSARSILFMCFLNVNVFVVRKSLTKRDEEVLIEAWRLSNWSASVVSDLVGSSSIVARN